MNKLALSVDPQLDPWRAPLVRVAIPARLAFDLDAFQETIATLARELGCEPCLSGANCLLAFINDYVVNPEGRLDPIPEQWVGALGQQFGP